MKTQAREQLEVVYRQLARTTGFSGFKPKFLFAIAAAATIMTACCVVLGASLAPGTIAIVWCGFALVVALDAAVIVLVPAFRSRSTITRSTARGVTVQMVPALAVGALVTGIILSRHEPAVAFLPAIWLACFGIGVASLSAMIAARLEYAWMVYFVGAAVAYVLRSESAAVFSGLVGVPFACGHLVTGLILQRSLPSPGDEADA